MSEVRAGFGRPRYASAQEAAGVAAECAQIIRRNEAETAMRRDLMAHAKAEIERHLSLDRNVEAAESTEREPEQVAAE